MVIHEWGDIIDLKLKQKSFDVSRQHLIWQIRCDCLCKKKEKKKYSGKVGYALVLKSNECMCMQHKSIFSNMSNENYNIDNKVFNNNGLSIFLIWKPNLSYSSSTSFCKCKIYTFFTLSQFMHDEFQEDYYNPSSCYPN